MSNFEAVKLYEVVIEEVIADSRQDFEDSGIDESTLQELKKLWCDKLSQFKVCNFSWDEEVEHSHMSDDVVCGPTSKADSSQLNAKLDLPLMSNYSLPPSLPHSHVHDETYNIGIEVPAVKRETEDAGLVMPATQSDGSLELTYLSSHSAAAQLFERVKRQVDGPEILNDADEGDDDVFIDSDDINSDLDDDLDSDKSDEDEGDQEGQIMLCLYDKVQRVKNKWKCNLKEGVANIDGKDFVFQRATGESEW